MQDSEPSTEPPAEPRVTTVADRVHRAGIDPYTAAPVVKLAPGVIGCNFCGNTKFRRSRVRFQDFREVLMLRYPLRCMRCNQRQYGYFLTAAFALAPKSQATRIARGKETWQAWTDGSHHPQMQRPMTSIGTRAKNLKPSPSRPTAPGQMSEADDNTIA